MLKGCLIDVDFMEKDRDSTYSNLAGNSDAVYTNPIIILRNGFE